LKNYIALKGDRYSDYFISTHLSQALKRVCVVECAGGAQSGSRSALSAGDLERRTRAPPPSFVFRLHKNANDTYLIKANSELSHPLYGNTFE
jgi:hypothetical protein